MQRWILLFALGFVVAPLCAAPRAQSAEECKFYWDIALVSRALAMEAGRDPTMGEMRILNILSRIYSDGGAAGDGRVGEIMVAIVQAALRETGGPAGDFAKRVGNACLAKRGDMDGVLGVRL